VPLCQPARAVPLTTRGGAMLYGVRHVVRARCPAKMPRIDTGAVAARMGGIGSVRRRIAVGLPTHEPVSADVLAIGIDRAVATGETGKGPLNAFVRTIPNVSQKECERCARWCAPGVEAFAAQGMREDRSFVVAGERRCPTIQADL